MTDSKYLPAFDGWLRTMGEDVLSLANLLEAVDAPRPFRQASAQALQYLLRSAVLIPEGLEALGYLEGAFAFRVIAQRALVEGSGNSSMEGATPDGPEAADRVEQSEGRVPRLAADVELIREFLGEDMPRLLELALAPAATTRAGRAAADLLDDDELRGTTLHEARQWVERYRAPTLRATDEEHVMLRSFFRTRLRRDSER